MPDFRAYARALDEAGEAQPRLVIDLDALDHNLGQVRRLAGEKALRLVEKSLPAASLLDYLMARLGTRRLMSFHLPFLQLDRQHFPDADLMLGKPLPVAAARRFYSEAPEGPGEPPVHWLIDTEDRLEAYRRLAQELRRPLSVVLEIDVGLHRGGFETEAALRAALDRLDAASEHLRLTGLMGYDAHVGVLPRLLGKPEAHLKKAMARYARLLAEVRRHRRWAEAPLILNTGGSPSLAYHAAEALSNEVAVGTALLKPCGYDLPSLAGFRPALFIATPVLKRLERVRLPGPEPLARWLGGSRPGVFVYGGNWLAEPCHPPGTRPHALFGRSSNQELLTLPRGTPLAPGDWLFLRPQQSEAVLTQFGALLAVRGCRIEARWPVYRD